MGGGGVAFMQGEVGGWVGGWSAHEGLVWLLNAQGAAFAGGGGWAGGAGVNQGREVLCWVGGSAHEGLV